MPRSLIAVVLAATAFSCAPEVRLGKNEGVPSFSGSAELALDGFRCGDTFEQAGLKVTTASASTGCALTFARRMKVLSAADTEQFSGAAGLFAALELEVSTFSVSDAKTGRPLEVKAMSLRIEGEEVASTESLAALPVTVRLDGANLEPLRKAVFAGDDVWVAFEGGAVLAATLPAKVGLAWAVQPSVLLGIPGAGQ